MTTIKICSDCKFIKHFSGKPMCTHTNSVIQIDLVSGGVTYMNCVDMRNNKSDDGCGSDGKLYQEKNHQSEPVKFFDKIKDWYFS